MKINMPLWPLLLVIILVAESAISSDDPIAKTPLGRLRGHVMTSRAGRKFLAFSGVPYAKPPVGELRFEAPLPIEPWSETKDALEDGPYCAQYNLFPPGVGHQGAEDCLYLSLYTHNLTDSQPVLVRIHGGGFTSGNGARLTGPQFLMDYDLVIVEINYRLSMFGFLSFEDKDMPGNQGLKDQTMALKWIQENIASFGGDPNRVTIEGDSAGGASVSHHTVSLLSRGLFQGVIAESGSSYTPWALSIPGAARNTSMHLLDLMGCQYATTKQAVACLRTKDAKQLANQLLHLGSSPGPVLEPPHPGAFLVGPISEWQHDSVPMMIGTTSAEGLMGTLRMNHTNEYYAWYYNNFEKVGLRVLLPEASFPNKRQEISREILQFYFPKGIITDEDFVNLTRMYSDCMFTVGIMDEANNHPGNVYFYYFDYLGYYSGAGDEPTRNKSLVVGAAHVDENIYLWYNKRYENIKGQDLEISKRLANLWAGFAIDGKPTMQEWTTWCKDKYRYFHISNNGMKLRENFAVDRYRFWKTLLAKYGKQM